MLSGRGGSRNKNDTNKSTLKITIQVNVESIQCIFGGSRNKNDTNKSTLKITIQVNVESIQCYLGGLETK